MRALITGGSGGIGLAAAPSAERGWRARGLVARDASRRRAAAEAIGGGAIWTPADVADAREVRRAVDESARQLGGWLFGS